MHPGLPLHTPTQLPAESDEYASQPRAFVAHQQMHDLLLVALISMHPTPEVVMREFRCLIERLTGASTRALTSDDSFAAAVGRSADRFDRMVQRVLPAINAEPAGTIASPGNSAGETKPET